MLHVDEGTLTAYLDGQVAKEDVPALEAHVKACGECRATLDDLRRVHERALAILRSGAPSPVPVPPFDDLVARAEAWVGKRADARRLLRLTSLAWAATVVLAVAVGWYARQWSFRASTVPESTAPAISAAPPSGEPSPNPPQRAAAKDEAPTSLPVAVAPTPAPGGPPASPAAASPSAGQLRTQDQLAGAAQALYENKAVAGVESRTTAKAANAGPAPSAAPEREGSARSVRAQALREESAATWADTSAAEAGRALGRAPLSVPGLPIERYSVRPGSGTVRVVQPLGEGRMLELVERAGSAGPGRGDGGGVTITVEGYSITATAPLPRDSVVGLVAKLR